MTIFCHHFGVDFIFWMNNRLGLRESHITKRIAILFFRMSCDFYDFWLNNVRVIIRWYCSDNLTLNESDFGCFFLNTLLFFFGIFTIGIQNFTESFFLLLNNFTFYHNNSICFWFWFRFRTDVFEDYIRKGFLRYSKTFG